MFQPSQSKWIANRKNDDGSCVTMRKPIESSLFPSEVLNTGTRHSLSLELDTLIET
jgi:hypothetical protein